MPDSYHLEIRPRPATGVCLKYTREPKPGVDPGGTFKLRMEDVTGLFVFDNGPVHMHDVGFRFHDAPVQFARGTVVVEDSGRFDLAVADLYARNIRLEQRLRSYMPPVMAQFAQRLDDGRTFTLKGNLGLGWSGQPGAPVRCGWDQGAGRLQRQRRADPARPRAGAHPGAARQRPRARPTARRSRSTAP